MRDYRRPLRSSPPPTPRLIDQRRRLSHSSSHSRQHHPYSRDFFRSPSRHSDPDCYLGFGSVPRDEKRDRHLEQLSEYSESLSRKESTFSKFQWHNLLADQKPSHSNANANLGWNPNLNTECNNDCSAEFSRKITTTTTGSNSGRGGFADLGGGVVPTTTTTTSSMPMENNSYMHGNGLDPTATRSRNYGVINDSIDYYNGRNDERKIGHGRTSVVDSIVDKIEAPPNGTTNTTAFFSRGNMRQSNRILDEHKSLREGQIDAITEFDFVEQGGEGEENFNDDAECWRKVGLSDRENLPGREDYGFKTTDCGGASGSSGNGFVMRVPISYDGLDAPESTTSQRTFTEAEHEVEIHDMSDMVLKRKLCLDMEEELSMHDQKRCLSCNWNAFDNEEIYDDMGSGDGQEIIDDIKAVPLLKNPRFGCSYGRVASPRTIDEMMDNGSVDSDYPLSYTYLPVSCKKHLRKTAKASKRDIKSRMGLVGNVKQRLGVPKKMYLQKPVKASKRDLRNRLGPAQSVTQRLGPIPKAVEGRKVKELPWVKIHERRLECFDGSFNGQGAAFETKKKKKMKPMKAEPLESTKDRKELKKTEPPEDSDEFLQLVQGAFLKFVKVLNENSAKRRKYMEQAGNGPLKCSICGSSKEFPDTLGLAQHAFTSCKVGSRSEHLGFHKALCALMGWASGEVPKSSWICQIMSEIEATSLKEDLIIWPPVVIIHNSSIANENPDERMIVSIEGLRTILGGMGFGQGMTNLCRGKAANHSTMVASFKGTFSGLQEAERLHRLYADNKRGRAELQHVGFKSSNSINAETRRIQADNEESILYGYMGIAGDLDKLDFETKKRCMVKSKKNIVAIADASLGTD